MPKLEITIDSKTLWVDPGSIILDAAFKAGVLIPTLCYIPSKDIQYPCGICVVEVDGREELVRACSALVEDGMVVFSRSDRVIEARQQVLKRMLSRHYGDCIALRPVLLHVRPVLIFRGILAELQEVSL